MEGILEDKILLAHGSGGKLAHELVEKSFLRAFDNPFLAKLMTQPLSTSAEG